MAKNGLNKAIDLDQFIKEKNNERLRGEHINQIKQDLSNEDLTKEEKALKYSEHLSWVLRKVKLLYQAKESSVPAAGKTPYWHGVTNGLIMALAIILEEQGDVPFVKKPKKYDLADEVMDDQLEEYVALLTKHLGDIVTAGPGGPEGYDEPAEWIQDVVNTLASCPVESKKLKEINKNIFSSIEKSVQ